MPGAMLGRNSTRSTSPSTIFIFCSAMPASPDPMSWLVTHSVDCWFAFIKQHTLGTSLEWSWWIVRTRRVSNRWDQGPCAFRNSRRTNTGRLSKANRPSNPEPDLVPETISPPYDRLPAQLQTLHLWALRRALPLVKTWGLTLQYDLSRLQKARTGNPHPLGKMPLVVLTASDFNVAQAPGVTADTLRQDHLRLQDDLASLSTDSRHEMVAGTGHEIYLYKPAVVVQSISAVVTSVRNGSRLSPVN
jgi:hypothetical protein